MLGKRPVAFLAIGLEAAPAGADQAQQQSNDHPAAERIVAEVMDRLGREEGPDVSQGRRRAIDEVGEPGVLRADEAPHDAEGDERQHAVAGVDMKQVLVAAEIGDDEPPRLSWRLFGLSQAVVSA